MADGPAEQLMGLSDAQSVADLARLLRQLRRREARRRADSPLTYRELAARTGWSHGALGQYFSGAVLPSTDRLDVLVRLLGASQREQGALATLRDRIEELRRVGTPDAGPRARVVRQLPPDVSAFTGRTDRLAELDRILTDEARTTAVVISAVSGTAGVGKTALAVHWAHRVAGRFPDGQLYVNLRGFDPDGRVMAPAEAVRGFLDALGVPADRIPPDADAQAALYRSVVAGKRILMLLDNARDADQVRPLLPGTATALVVVTSRNQLIPLVAAAGARPLALDLLPMDEARELLAQRLGADRVTAESEATDQIITACARLPLALAIAAARAAQTGFPLATIAAELDKADQRLDALDAGDRTSQVRAVFSWSYAALSAPAARLFRLLGLHPGAELSILAAASVGGHPVPDTRRLLTELARANLLTEHLPGRYGWHDLLRAYATELTNHLDPDDQRRAAVNRLLDHYVHTAYAAARVLQPHRDPIPLPLAAPVNGAVIEQLADFASAMAWLAAERQTLLAVLRQAAETSFEMHAWQLAWSLTTFHDRRGHWHDTAATWQVAIRAAETLGDRSARAFAHRVIGGSAARLGLDADGHRHLQQGLDLYVELGDLVGQAYIHRNLAYLSEVRGRPAEALHHARQALALYQATGHRRGQANVLNVLGWYHAQLGEHAQALAPCRSALALFQELGDREGQANTWDSLGYAHQHLGHHAEAVECYQQALALDRGLGDRCAEAATFDQLGDTHQAARDPVAAREAWRQALIIFTELGRAEAEGVQSKLDRQP